MLSAITVLSLGRLQMKLRPRRRQRRRHSHADRSNHSPPQFGDSSAFSAADGPTSGRPPMRQYESNIVDISSAEDTDNESEDWGIDDPYL